MTEILGPQDERVDFEARLGSFSETEQRKIMSAYDLAKDAHEGQFRLSGEPYFEHPRDVALILLDELKITDMSMICGALLHDVAEDTTAFGDPKKLGYTKYAETVREQVARDFSPETAEIVISVTEPPIDNIEIFNRPQAKKIKYELLRKASPEALLVKMADRLHNLRTFYPKEGRKTPVQKIDETMHILMSKEIFMREDFAYPYEQIYMVSEMFAAMMKLIKKYPDSI